MIRHLVPSIFDMLSFFLSFLIHSCLKFYLNDNLLHELRKFVQVFQPWIQRRKLAFVKHKHVIFGLLRHLKQQALGRLLTENGEPDREIIEKFVAKRSSIVHFYIAFYILSDSDSCSMNIMAGYFQELMRTGMDFFQLLN